MDNKKNTILKIQLTVILLGSCIFSPLYCQLPDSFQHRLSIQYVDKDSSFNGQGLQLKTDFYSQPLCLDYINKLPVLLQLQGYISASVDSILLDAASTRIQLYLGRQQKWVQLSADSIDKKALDAGGFFSGNFSNKSVNFTQVQLLKERMLNFYENNGYPFAAVYLDSIRLDNDGMNAVLKVKQGPLYHVDSIRVFGKVKISNYFLQRYLSISNKSIYSKDKLEKVGKRIIELPYVQEQQPSDLTMLGTGSVLNLYLQPKRSSQVNFLIGFLPANNESGKLQLTGDVNLNLKNALGGGETIALNWQQLQLKSPRLNIAYQHPYIFKSPFGIDFSFGLFKKDSTFLQLNAQLGIQYLLAANQSGKLFIQQQKTTLLGSGVDTNQVKFTKKLPPNIDVNAVSIGLDYEWTSTNYKFNPRTGNELSIVTTVGMKTISRNNDIISITDPSFDYRSLYDSLKLKTYQLRVKLNVAHYFPAGKRSTLKMQLNAGVFNSPSIFRNELFQIGGFKLLRGFDEESIYATRFGVATAEYRYLLGLNSYMFGFFDAGWVKNKYQGINASNNFISTGIGLLFETKFGLLNMSFAVGKRSDVKLDLKSASKIHFGYINYF
ncbi:MAG: BamA/TamA family outer membrane protein [Chitinophagaceae bacterium]|nr:BamA/TamA family outer membrane protein [Chitinophagaceae bacterium]